MLPYVLVAARSARMFVYWKSRRQDRHPVLTA